MVMAYAFYVPRFDGYMMAAFFIALGGTFIFVPSFTIANAFPKYCGAVVALVSGSYDASAAVLLFYRIAYERSGGSFSPRQFFSAYVCVPCIVLVAQYTFMNKYTYKIVSRSDEKSGSNLSGSDNQMSEVNADRSQDSAAEQRGPTTGRFGSMSISGSISGGTCQRVERASKEERRRAIAGIWGILHGKHTLQQLLSPWFVLMLFLTVLQMIRMNFFIATIRSQYEQMLASKELAVRVNHFFDIALPVRIVTSRLLFDALR